MASGILASGIAIASQFVVARHAGVSLKSSALYSIVSAATALVALDWFQRCRHGYYQKKIPYDSSNGNYSAAKEKVDKIRDDRFPRDLAIMLLSSHALGRLAGSVASVLTDYPYFKPLQPSTTVMMSGLGFGLSALMLLAAKDFDS